MDSHTRKAELVYRETFERFSKNVQQVQEFIASSKSEEKVVDAALIELQKSYLDYERARDTYAGLLLWSTNGPALAPRRGGHQNPNAIRVIAELLWETAGRPEGTAENDWHRAEEIVRKAAAA